MLNSPSNPSLKGRRTCEVPMANIEADGQAAGGSEMQDRIADLDAGQFVKEGEEGQAIASVEKLDDAPQSALANTRHRHTAEKAHSGRVAGASGDSSPGTGSSNSADVARGGHSRTPTSDESLLRRSFSRDYNFSPEIGEWFPMVGSQMDPPV